MSESSTKDGETAPPIVAWILAGALEGTEPELPLIASVAGMPMLLRHACEAIGAGAETVSLLWLGDDDPPPDTIDAIEKMARDELLRGIDISVHRECPEAPADCDVLLIRSDRIFHRDLPKHVLAGAMPESVRIVAGQEADSVFAAPKGLARTLVDAAGEDGGLEARVAELESAGKLQSVEPPYLSFAIRAPDAKARSRGEKLLVHSLRKAADGYAARLINRHISLFLSRYLSRTSILPNHVTVLCLISALTGGIIISRGGYANGIIGMLLVELGSILDGIDGELARLKFRFSRVGQWMDTVTDDLSNVFLAVGTAVSLNAAGVEWAIPLAAAGLVAFFITQSSQYYFIATRYNSGDLAAIPWAFQSTDFLESRPIGLLPRLKAGIPRLLKRDFSVTLFVVLAIAGFLEGVLLLFAGGSIVFLFSYTLQYLRVRPTLRSSA